MKKTNTMKYWQIYDLEGNQVGMLADYMAEDEDDAVQTFAEGSLRAYLANPDGSPVTDTEKEGLS